MTEHSADLDDLAAEAEELGVRVIEERFGDDEWGDWEEHAVDPRYVDNEE